MVIAPDKRRSGRRIPAPKESIRRVRSRTGHDLDVIDVSHSGLLIECRARLLPNTHMDIHIVVRTGRVLIRCRVVRASVCHVEADLVRYRVGLAFDHPLDTSPGYSVPGDFPHKFQAAGSAYPDSTAVASEEPPIVASSE
jgi:PilZ domain